MLDAVPHPLVAELVQKILSRRLGSYDAAKQHELAAKIADPDDAQVQAALGVDPPTNQARETLFNAMTAVLEKDPKKLTGAEKKRLVEAAGGVDFPDLVALAGYLGGTVEEHPPSPRVRWRILYLDSQLQNWRLILDEDILVFNRMRSDDAAFNRRDVIWVDRDALTATGGAPPRPDEQARYLRGNFTRAGDLVAPGTGGGPAPDPQTGVFCPITPRCCTRPVRP